MDMLSSKFYFIGGSVILFIFFIVAITVAFMGGIGLAGGAVIMLIFIPLALLFFVISIALKIGNLISKIFNK